MQKVGTCKKCGKNDLKVEKGAYTCKGCGHTGSVKEWIPAEPK